MTKLNSELSTQKMYPANLFQGAIIDRNGKEIPITESMIQQACKALEAEASSIYNELAGHTESKPARKN